MASYDGAPSIRLEGDEKRALALIPEGKLLLSKAQAFTKRAEIPTYSMSRRVSDDEYIYVLVAGDQNIIQISAGVVVPDRVLKEPEAPEPSLFPDFLSGLVFNGILDKHEEVKPDGTKVSYKLLRQWAPTPGCARVQKINTGRQPSRRLSVQPHSSMYEWSAPSGSTLDYSQYVVPRSSMWSGTMRKVVQVVFGFGRLNKNKLRDPNRPGVTTEYMKDVDTSGVQVQYDYKFMRTHGVYKGPDGVLWLIEISAGRGVVAMPLPVFPGSKGEGFANIADARGDAAMRTALDELGCLPTGQGFPTGAAFNKKVESGHILQLLGPEDMAEFYRLSGFSSACGWAFSERGNEAHNVGYLWEDGDPIQKGFWYQVSINIGALKTDREPGEPIADGSASLKLQQRGNLYSPPVRKSFLPLKYHEPLLPGLLSHSARPSFGNPAAPKCDTPVFVAFINGDLKVGRYFHPGRDELANTSYDERTGESCMLEGSWTWKYTYGSATMPSMPYTNDIDPRTVLEENVTEGELTSNSLGFDPPQFSDFIEAPEACAMWRNKVWKQNMVEETRGGETRTGCLVVPGHSREAYYFFEAHAFAAGRRGYKRVYYEYVQDPFVYYGWRKFPRINLPAYPRGYGCEPSNCGGKNPDRRVICEVYGAHQCSDYAESGPWAEQCANIESMCSTPPERVPTFVPEDRGSDFTGTWNLVIHGIHSIVSGQSSENDHAYAMLPSPDPATGLVQTLYAQSSSIGEDCVIYTEGFRGRRVVTGYTPVLLQDSDWEPTFIGVNQP